MANDGTIGSEDALDRPGEEVVDETRTRHGEGSMEPRVRGVQCKRDK